ncbi:hypothetical protein [Natronorubrum sp. DTA28]|uniref:hypothetical protein n=1 Tax=Natronorubrum sp. DTA28 TaxID=3447019 RepID=UPI003F84EF48
MNYLLTTPEYFYTLELGILQMPESTAETGTPLSSIHRILVALLTIAGLAGLYFAVGVLFVGSGLVDTLLGFVGLVVASSAAYWIFHLYTNLKNAKKDNVCAE